MMQTNDVVVVTSTYMYFGCLSYDYEHVHKYIEYNASAVFGDFSVIISWFSV